MNREIIAVIPAAGVGSRMQANKTEAISENPRQDDSGTYALSHSIPSCNQSRYPCGGKK